MTLSHQPDHHDQLVRYLLGLLPHEDAERLDEMSIADDEVAWRLRVVEDDLVDAYINGTLTGEALERFESFYLSSDRRRQKVRFARSFRGAVEGGARPAAIEAGRGSNGAREIVTQSRAPWRVAAAALILLACGALYEDLRVHRALNEARSASAVLSNRAHDLEQQLVDQRVADAGIVKELESVRAPGAAAAQSSAAARPTGLTERPSRELPTMALVLLPQTRAIGPIAALAVPKEVDRVALDLRLEPNDFSRYQAALRDPGTNQIVWRSDRITARTAEDLPTVSVLIPASVLKAQHYSLELNGLSAAGGAEVVGSYVFQVMRR